MPKPLEFRSQFTMIVDLPVKHQNGVTVLTEERLPARREIDNLQSHGSERDALGFIGALVVGTAVHQGMGRSSDYTWIKCTAAVGIACYTAHVCEFSVIARARRTISGAPDE
jgi:hypothetical protein